MKREGWIVCLLVFLSRIPFLSDGYGHEEDSWGLVLNAFGMSESGTYEASRLPGHPFQEYLYSFLAPFATPFLFNLISAILSVLGVFFFIRIGKILLLPHPELGGFLLGLVPVYFAASTYTIDFVWAASFALGSGFFLLRKKYWVAGLFLGLAMACRITSGAWLFCFLPLVGIPFFSKDSFLIVSKVLTAALLVTILFYIPVVNRYGWGFFMYYDQFPYPNIFKLFYKMSIGVWGPLGILAIGIFLIPALRTQVFNNKILFALIIATVLFLISYLRLPQKSGYMIPLIPFVLLFFMERLKGKSLLIFSCLIILSPWVMGINISDGLRGAEPSGAALHFKSGGQDIFLDPVSGPIFNEKSKRKNKLEYSDRVIMSLDTMVVSKIICGWWYNELAVKMYSDPRKQQLAFYLTEKEMTDMPITVDINSDRRGSIYYLPEQDLYNNQYSGITTTNKYAEPFPVK